MVSCSSIIWITYSSDHSPDLPGVTGICDPNNSRARYHRSSTEIFLLIERHTFLQALKPQLVFFRNFYGLTSTFK